MEEPQIAHLPYQRRKRFFWVLVLIFLFALPSLIFYTTGYRLSFENEETSIVTTGGMYITTDNLDVDVYLDEIQVDRPRLFRSAYYIQNIAAGKHRIVVQRPDLYTWVKELPVDPYIVIEAAAFNMPVTPHIRPIAEYTDIDGTMVFQAEATSTALFPKATTTVPFRISTSTATTSLAVNEEYIYVASLFSTTSTSTQSVFSRFFQDMDRFRFATTSDDQPNDEQATSTEEQFIERGNMRLVERRGELYATWRDSVSSIPYYFCVTAGTATSTAQRYGEHVANDVARLRHSTTTPLLIDGDRVCRPEIKLDRKRQDVFYYDFFPNNPDLVVLQLEDGVYVTEIDDRAWQNTQLLYPGDDLRVVVENDSIYIEEAGRLFEILTEIELDE